MLPPPSGKGAKRAADLFKRLVRMQREGGAESEPSPVVAERSQAVDRTAYAAVKLPRPDEFGAGRSYDLALAVVSELELETESSFDTAHLEETREMGIEPQAPPLAADADVDSDRLRRARDLIADPVSGSIRGPEPALDLEETREIDAALPVDDVADLLEFARVEAAESTVPAPVSPEPEQETVPQQHPERAAALETVRYQAPPMIRPSVKRPAPRAPVVSKELLQKAAKGARLIAEPDGSTSFDITFNDEVFDDLSCRITVTGDQIIAVFTVQDQNLRRLLEAESGRLRAQLEGRGLRVGEIRVEVIES